MRSRASTFGAAAVPALQMGLAKNLYDQRQAFHDDRLTCSVGDPDRRRRRFAPLPSGAATASGPVKVRQLVLVHGLSPTDPGGPS
jgi:hypothetical protein